MSSSKCSIGFVGLGVMGEPMCRNLLSNAGPLMGSLTVLDTNPAPVAALVSEGAVSAPDIPTLAASCDFIFLSLPGGAEVEAVINGNDGLLQHARAGTTMVDLSTSPVALTRELAAQAQQHSINYADAPVARTRAAAVNGTLAIMVGGSKTVFDTIQPLLACMASDILHCGDVGSGQMVKILNNMVLFQTVLGLSEALTMAKRAGLDGNLLFDALAQGSANSFALNNHGKKAMLADDYPLNAFSTRYAMKDLDYALQLAEDTATPTSGAETVKQIFQQTIDAGYADEYWPVMMKTINEQSSNTDKKP